MQNKSINPKRFCNFMLVNNMGATFQDDLRIDENEKIIYSVSNIKFSIKLSNLSKNKVIY
jgi:hypothetical protein